MVFIILIVIIIVLAVYYFKRQSTQRSPVNVEAKRTDVLTEKMNSFSEPDKSYEVNATLITCTCPNFREDRQQFSSNDPRRLCKHLVKHFLKNNSLPPNLYFYKDGIEWCAQYNRGFPFDKNKFDDVIGDKRISIMTPKMITEDDYWVDVYYDGKRYGYTLAFEKWSYETPPPYEEKIVRLLYKQIGDSIPEPLPLNSIKTLSSTQIDANCYIIKGELARNVSEIQIIEAQIKPRAAWIEYITDQNKGSFNIKTKEHILARKRHIYLKDALEKWLLDEYSNIKQSYNNIQSVKREKPYKTTDDELGGFQIIESLLKNNLPSEATLTFKDTKSYFAVTINNSRKWICRLYFNSEKAKYIEFPDGKRFEVMTVEDISKYKDQLIKTVGEMAGNET
jgi:hypothetical protein